MSKTQDFTLTKSPTVSVHGFPSRAYRVVGTGPKLTRTLSVLRRLTHYAVYFVHLGHIADSTFNVSQTICSIYSMCDCGAWSLVEYTPTPSLGRSVFSGFRCVHVRVRPDLSMREGMMHVNTDPQVYSMKFMCHQASQWDTRLSR